MVGHLSVAKRGTTMLSMLHYQPQVDDPFNFECFKGKAKELGDEYSQIKNIFIS